MIQSFGNKNSEKIWNGERVKKPSALIQKNARRKLRMLNNAANLQDLRIPPSNRLEKLSGDLADFYSIRINDQWRIIFHWIDSNSHQVQIIDYH
jgi:toxin HigB-1